MLEVPTTSHSMIYMLNNLILQLGGSRGPETYVSSPMNQLTILKQTWPDLIENFNKDNPKMTIEKSKL